MATDDQFPDNIGSPARSALEAAGMTSLTDLTDHTRKEILALHGMGPKALGRLEEAMNARGLSFADVSSGG